MASSPSTEEISDDKRVSSYPEIYWYINAGESARLWGRFLEGGFISVFDYSATRQIDLSDYSKDQLLELVFEIFQTEDISDDPRYQVSTAWRFVNELKVGDRIIAKDGTRRILGCGVVRSGYQHTEGAEQVHRRNVTWLGNHGPVDLPATITLPRDALGVIQSEKTREFIDNIWPTEDFPHIDEDPELLGKGETVAEPIRDLVDRLLARRLAISTLSRMDVKGAQSLLRGPANWGLGPKIEAGDFIIVYFPQTLATNKRLKESGPQNSGLRFLLQASAASRAADEADNFRQVVSIGDTLDLPVPVNPRNFTSPPSSRLGAGQGQFPQCRTATGTAFAGSGAGAVERDP